MTVYIVSATDYENVILHVDAHLRTDTLVVLVSNQAVVLERQHQGCLGDNLDPTDWQFVDIFRLD